MKNMKTNKIITLFLAFAVFMALLPGGVAASAESAERWIGPGYVALGDSVAAHYGLPEDMGYAGLFSRTLAGNGYLNKHINLGRDGLDSTGLLELLSSGELREAAGAQIITLSIGGNNLLGGFIDMVDEAIAGRLEAMGISGIAEASPAQVRQLGAILAQMKLSYQQKEILRSGTAELRNDLPLIIEGIREIAPDAVIIVTNTYNPIPAQMAAYGDVRELVSELNAVISSVCTGYEGVHIADVYTAFISASESQVNIDLAAGSVDIHPNADGHRTIARLCWRIYSQLGIQKPGKHNFTRMEGYEGFPDVSEGAWYGTEVQGVIKEAWELGIIQGHADGYFRPEDRLRLSEAVKMACVVHSTYSTIPLDLGEGASPWYTPYMDYADRMGLTAGMDVSIPDREASRGEMAALFARTMPEYPDITGSDGPPDMSETDSFWEEVLLLYRAGVLTGVDESGSFEPGRTITRAEAAAVIARVAG